MKAIEVFSVDRKIVMSSAFEKKSRKFGSPEYKMLQEARRDNPGYAAPAVLAGLEYLINISKSHSKCKRYSTVKSWFLKRYPDVEIFGMDDEKLDEHVAELIEKHNQKKELAQEENTDNVVDLPATGTEG